MATVSQREKFQTLMKGTILSLCQNVLDHKTEIKVEVFFGITLDKKTNFHFSVVETLHADTGVSGSTEIVVQKPEQTPPAENQVQRSRSQLFSGPPPPAIAQPRASSMLERLMTQEPQRTQEYFNREVSPSPRNKSREVTSSTPAESKQKSSSLSYSELLRSFGEMSRQDNAPNVPSSQFSNMPMNFSISTSQNSAGISPGANYDNQQNNNWGSQEASKPPRSKMPRLNEGPPPDSTFGSTKPTDFKVKQEVLSEEEDFEPPPPSMSTLRGALLQNLQQPGKDISPTASTDSSLSSRGILMSLLCEKPPEAGKRRGRPKKRAAAAPDPAFPSPLPASTSIPPRDPSTLRDNRVLIGLTDYLSGFKEGDLTQEKPPRLMFSSKDIVAKTRKIVLLNSGPFSTVRMVHRSLQGMKAPEISEVMESMTLPRNHPDYIGEYKVVTMAKVRQGRKNVGVFFKCPPEIISIEALGKSDILLEDYLRFFNCMFKYDRVPQPQYFEAIEEASPFTGIFHGGDRGWKDDPSFDPTQDFKSFYNVYNEEENQSLSTSSQQEADSHTGDDNNTALDFHISKIKTEKLDWDSIPETAAATSTQRSNSDYEHSQDEYMDPGSEDMTFDPMTSAGVSTQPVFPQPFIVQEQRENEEEEQ